MEEAVDEGRRARRFRLSFYKGWCKRCGICIAFCPKGVLEENEEGYPRLKEGERCVGCRLCELRCPDFAVEVEEDADARTE